jgi:hypothetical protein
MEVPNRAEWRSPSRSYPLARNLVGGVRVELRAADYEWQHGNKPNRSMLRRFPRLSFQFMGLLALH